MKSSLGGDWQKMVGTANSRGERAGKVKRKNKRRVGRENEFFIRLWPSSKKNL